MLGEKISSLLGHFLAGFRNFSGVPWIQPPSLFPLRLLGTITQGPQGEGKKNFCCLLLLPLKCGVSELDGTVGIFLGFFGTFWVPGPNFGGSAHRFPFSPFVLVGKRRAYSKFLLPLRPSPLPNGAEKKIYPSLISLPGKARKKHYEGE